MIAARKDNRTGKIQTRVTTPSQVVLNLVLVTLVLLTIYGFFTIDTRNTDLGRAAWESLEYIRQMFLEAAANGARYDVPENNAGWTFMAVAEQAGITLALAFLTTVIGAIVALFLGLLAARNLTNEKVSNVVKSLVAVVRSVPTVLWVLIFSIGAGLGSVAAVIGMSFHTVGYLMKAYSESFEEIDQGVIEALRAQGATWPQIVFQAVFPATATYLLSWTFIRFEINFAVAVAMGAAAGAGGIGFNLLLASARFVDFREVGYLTYIILAVAVIMELIANRMKSKLHIHD